MNQRNTGAHISAQTKVLEEVMEVMSQVFTLRVCKSLFLTEAQSTPRPLSDSRTTCLLLLT